jgi:hypothetical protein
MPFAFGGKTDRLVLGRFHVRYMAGQPVHHDQARLWFGSATPNDHALRISQATALRPLGNQTVTGEPLEWDVAPYPRLAPLMKSTRE